MTVKASWDLVTGVEILSASRSKIKAANISDCGSISDGENSSALRASLKMSHDHLSSDNYALLSSVFKLFIVQQTRVTRSHFVLFFCFFFLFGNVHIFQSKNDSICATTEWVLPELRSNSSTPCQITDVTSSFNINNGTESTACISNKAVDINMCRRFSCNNYYLQPFWSEIGSVFFLFIW